MAKKKRKVLTKEEQIARLEKFLEGKELRPDGEAVFKKGIDTAVKKRGTKP